MTTPDIQSLVESVLRLDKDANPAPWDFYDGWDFIFSEAPERKIIAEVRDIGGDRYENASNNGNLIRAYRTAAPILATELTRLRAELAEEKRKVEVASEVIKQSFELAALIRLIIDEKRFPQDSVWVPTIAAHAYVIREDSEAALADLTTPSEKGAENGNR